MAMATSIARFLRTALEFKKTRAKAIIIGLRPVSTSYKFFSNFAEKSLQPR